jgi:hypothetical protein
MIVEKCDLCKKELPRGEYVRAGDQGIFGQYSFCEKCAGPILAFLKKHHLAKKQGKSLRKI